MGAGVPSHLKENTMSQDRSTSPRRKRFGVDHAEEKAWIGFYRRVGDPVVAAEILHELQSDPEMKRAHLALYLRCKESLRANKVRLARNKRIGQCVRLLCSAVFLTPARAVNRLLHRSTDLAVECLPELAAEPAARQVRKLTVEAEFAQERSAFVAGSVPTSPKPDAAPSAPKSA
jgi:hypothetical protein